MNYSIQVSRESKELLESAAIESLSLFSDELVALAKRAKIEQPKTSTKPSTALAPAPSRPAMSAKPATAPARQVREQPSLPRPLPAPLSLPSTASNLPLNRIDSIRRKGLDSAAAIKADTYRVAPPTAAGQQPPFVSYSALLVSLQPPYRGIPRKSSAVAEKPQAL